MSLDNVIAVAGAANGSMLLVTFGILVSIPIVVWGSQLVLKLMDRYPIVITAGGALLGWIGGGMMVSDPALPAGLLDGIPYPKTADVRRITGALLVDCHRQVAGNTRTAPRAAIELTAGDSTKGSS
jgi:predicted tellurium resistance membrane protein TerC